jgi:hypothetical protein
MPKTAAPTLVRRTSRTAAATRARLIALLEHWATQ